MASLTEKTAVVDSLKSAIDEANIIIVADYRGLTNAELTQLRGELRAEKIRIQVAKNTLVKRAIAGTAIESMSPYLAGPTALVLGYGDQVAAVKLVKEFLKKNKKTNELRGGFLDGTALSAAHVTELADLPSMDVLRGKLVMCIASPITGLVHAINSPAAGLVNCLDQLAEKKETGEVAA